MRARLVASCLASAALLASCAVETFTLEDGPAAAATTGSGGGGGTGGAGGAGGGEAGGTCGHASYPLPPTTTSSGEEDVVVALRTIDMGEKAASPPGLDLDGKCSCCCEGDGPGCLEKKVNCDGPLGVDNAAAGMFKLVSLGLDNFSSSFFSSQAEKGFWGLVLRIREYNGMPNDDQVVLEWYTSEGTADAAGLPTTPVWNGNDAWIVSTDSLLGVDGDDPDPLLGVDGNLPRFADTKAYVTEGQLVASLPDTVMAVGGALNKIAFHVVGAFIVADLVKDEVSGRYSIPNGLFVARWRIQDFFLTMSTYRDADGKPFCTDDLLYQSAKPTICNSVDIYSGTSTPTTECDSFSLGMAFTAGPATLGLVKEATPASPACPDETDPIHDSCP